MTVTSCLILIVLSYSLTVPLIILNKQGRGRQHGAVKIISAFGPVRLLR